MPVALQREMAIAIFLHINIVVSCDGRCSEFTTKFDAFGGRCSITDDVSKDGYLIGSAGLNFLEYGFEGGEVGVDIGYDGDFRHL